MATADIQKVYLGLLGRPADEEGLAYWNEEIENGTLTLEQLRANIVNEQPEFADGPGQLSRADFVTQLYANMFGREPDDAADYWLTGDGASVNLDQLVMAFTDGASEEDTVALNNRATVAQLITDAGLALEGDAATILEGVTNDPDTVTAAQQTVEERASGEEESISGGGTDPVFDVNEDGDTGNFSIGNEFGDVAVTLDSGNLIFTPNDGEAFTIDAVQVDTLTTDGINLSFTKAVLDEITSITTMTEGSISLSSATSTDLKTDFAKLSAGGSLNVSADEAVKIAKVDLDLIDSLKTTSGDITLTGATNEDLSADIAKLAPAGSINIEAVDESLTVTESQLLALASVSVTGNSLINLTEATAANLDSNLSKLTATPGVINVALAGNDDLSGFDLSSIGTLTLSGTTVLDQAYAEMPSVDINASGQQITLATEGELALASGQAIDIVNHGALELAGNNTTYGMTVSQHSGFTSIIGNENDITLYGKGVVTGASDVTTYTLSNYDAIQLTLGSLGQNVDATSISGATLNFDIAGKYNGIVETQESDALNVIYNADISGVIAEGIEGGAFNADTLAIYGSSGNSVSMTGAQLGGFTNNITGTGSFRLTDALSGGELDNITLPHLSLIYMFDSTNVLTTKDSLVAGNDLLEIFAGGPTGTHPLTFDGSAETGGAFTVLGSAVDDHITGGARYNVITGYGGADTLVGGSGQNIFVYNEASDSSAGSYDRIVNFSADTPDNNKINVRLVDFANDAETVENVNNQVSGSVDTETLVTDLNALLNVAGGAGYDTDQANDVSAALVEVNGGDLSGKKFLAIDVDGNDEFSADDLLIEITGISGTFDLDNFAQ
ncbi:DUF4214 domain-containing protein [Halomonas sp. CUBES01]|uniref:beta strand repeat-containing protein n=1 Tax=Halomonas sp. CUBES01 TaxID=2897340 RepID=UPI001E614844|nr:DUF4214 domain-containing protein [Halomonas sp. CUBES01]MEC4766713.1 DUF4214 domain-containing protein [Halomonas sp. CUBES01]